MTTERGSEIEFLEARIVLSSYAPLLQLGTAGNALVINTITTDASGNFYVAGGFGGKVDFDPRRNHTTIVDGGDGSGFIARYCPNGGVFWVIPLRYAANNYYATTPNFA